MTVDAADVNAEPPVAQVFHMEEYRLLRSEIALLLEYSDKVLYVTVVAVGGVIVWLAKQPSVSTLLPWVPLLGFGFGAALYGQKTLQMMEVAQYIRRIESAYADKAIGGWESGALTGTWNKRNRRPTMMIFAIWIAIFLVSGVFALSKTLSRPAVMVTPPAHVEGKSPPTGAGGPGEAAKPHPSKKIEAVVVGRAGVFGRSASAEFARGASSEALRLPRLNTASLRAA